MHRVHHDPWALQGVHRDVEPDESGRLVGTAAVLLTGRQCPWSCVMCDLWRHTLDVDTPAGAIPHQVALAIEQLTQGTEPSPRHLKLYNAGSFFDPRAVPPGDYRATAAHLAPFDRVVVESHPALIGPRVLEWTSLLEATSEVAMGLETAHPAALARLNKGMSVDGFARAAEWLTARGIGVRVFLLVQPPFVPRELQAHWLLRSLDTAIDHGASVVALIPLRTGTEALEAAVIAGEACPPTLAELEQAFVAALAHVQARRATMRVFVDTWDLDRLAACVQCRPAIQARLRLMNQTQRIEPGAPCAH